MDAALIPRQLSKWALREEQSVRDFVFLAYDGLNREVQMKTRNLGYLGFLGTLGLLGLLSNKPGQEAMAAFYGLFGLYGLFGFFSVRDK